MKRLYKVSSALVTAVCVIGSAYGAQPSDVVQSDSLYNTAMGTDALLNNVGNSNTAAGFQALASNTSGYVNAAFGSGALATNTSGAFNSAFGSGALEFSNGNMNAAFGNAVLSSNDNGNSNTGVGAYSLWSNSQGSYNTATGNAALSFNVGGSNNTAAGFNSALHNLFGNDNTAMGANALLNNQGGSLNIAVGYYAGSGVRGGNYNIEIGNVGTANDVGTIRIGTAGQQSSAYVAGVSSSHVTGAAVYVTPTGQLGVLASSERYKTNVASLGASTEKLAKLRAVSFSLKSDPKAGRQYGLIAEEVAKVYPELVIRNEAGQAEGVRYEELAPMLLNEVQQQQRELRALKQQVAQLQGLQRGMH
jgi:Chaperone of endosialidase